MAANTLGAAARRLRSTRTNFITHATRTFKVYTRTGDEGTSMLFNAERRAKDDAVFQALGSTDELNACVGIARAHAEDCEAVAPLPGRSAALHNPLAGLVEQLGAVQSRLFDAGSRRDVMSRSTDAKLRRAAFGDDGASSADELEWWIDGMDAELPPLSNFILPGGGLVGASLHHARRSPPPSATSCRSCARPRRGGGRRLPQSPLRLPLVARFAARASARRTPCTRRCACAEANAKFS